MKNSDVLKEKIKKKIENQFYEIKKQSGYHRLYTFILNKVNNSHILFLTSSGTLKNLKDKIDAKNFNYTSFWLAKEMNLTCENNEPLQQEIVQKLENLNQDEIDLLLIESLKELKEDGLFYDEIPEFSVFIQDNENTIRMDEDSFKTINGKSYWNAFKNRNLNSEISLTNLLLDKYNLR